mgnify:CR=1 FL=1
MQEAYGEEMAKINGFADVQLSYTDFIDNFIDKDTVADVSVDGNANVGNKDMRTLMNEMPKPHRKLLSFHKIYYELNKKYGFNVYIGSLTAVSTGYIAGITLGIFCKDNTERAFFNFSIGIKFGFACMVV